MKVFLPTSRVVRGGAFNFNGNRVRCAYRDGYSQDARHYWLGFRVVRIAVHQFSIRKEREMSKVEFEWCAVPAGEFIYGSKEDDDVAYFDEKPQSRVYLDEFEISKHAVTNEQWSSFCKDTNRKTPPHFVNGEPPKGRENHPVVNVSWQDANDFCAWAGVRLPSEKEWEKAARGTDGRIYPWGDEFDEGKCNSWKTGIQSTVPVNAFQNGASPYGCLNMSGNVWEWTSSVYDD